jgi:hypothetical protein
MSLGSTACLAPLAAGEHAVAIGGIVSGALPALITYNVTIRIINLGAFRARGSASSPGSG